MRRATLHAGREQGGLDWSDGPLAVAPLAFFDLETTGLRPDRGARVTEVALLEGSRVALHRRASPREASPLDWLSTLLRHLAGSVLVGHNLRFDLTFVAYEARRHGCSLPRLQFIDTLGLARTVLGDGPDLQLEALLHQFGLTPEAPLHQALVDAKATRTLFWRLVEEGGFETLADAGAKPLAWTAP